MRFIDRLERKFGRYAINNFILTVVVGMGAVFLADMMFPDYDISGWLAMVPSLVLKGQVWRLITFIFIPPSSSPVFVVFALYFYYFIGNALDYEWGSFKFGVFYLLGVIGSLIAGFITGYAINTYLNLSLFLAFAILFPNVEFRIFFILPVKAKYLALVDVLGFVVMMIIGSWQIRAAIIASLINLIIFFGGEVWLRIKDWWAYRETRRNYRKQTSGQRYNNRYR